MAYVDGFVIPMPRKNLAAYRRMASSAGKIWMDHGALEYVECVGEDLDVKMGKPFPKQLGVKRGETVVFSWIVYRSRAHRDQVNARVMKDPRMTGSPQAMPFELKRMCYGGFTPIVELRAGVKRAVRRTSRQRPRANGHAEATPEQPGL